MATKIFKNNRICVFKTIYVQFDVVQTNEHSEIRQIVRAIRRDKNFCQFKDKVVVEICSHISCVWYLGRLCK